MFFTCDNLSGFHCAAHDSFFIKRLNGVDVNQVNRNPFRFQFASCFNSFPNKVSGCNDCHVVSLVNVPCFSNFEILINSSEVRHLRSSETQVNRTVMIGNSESSCFSLIVIARINNGHARKHAHHSNIF